MSSFKHILTKSQNGVKTITLNRPDKRNALSPMLIDELTQALHEAETCDCGVVILTGAGPSFCSGLDMEHLATMNARTPQEHRVDSENMAHVLRTLYDFPKPIIAAVNGPAIAGGMALAAIPDFTIAVPRPSSATPRCGWDSFQPSWLRSSSARWANCARANCCSQAGS